MMNYYILTLVIILESLTVTTEGARILAIEPVPGKSHMTVFSALTNALSYRNHEIVMVSAFPLNTPRTNYTDIDIMKYFKGDDYNEGIKQLYNMGDLHALLMPLALWNLGIATSQLVLNIPEVKALLDDKHGFDLVIVEAFMNEAIYGFADYFKAPLIIVCPFGGFHFMNYGPGNPMPLSYVPNSMLSYSHEMTFLQRFSNTLLTVLWDIGHYLYYLPKQEAIRQEIFGDGKNVWALQRYTSLTLLNNHFSLHYPRPLVPSIIEVGGMHVSRELKHLPADIKQFLDDAKEGAILFSMGSHLRSDFMPSEKLTAFMSAFFELPQRVLWKWESENLPGKPSNVMTKNWLPQQEILAHPNVRLFITHGGLLSSQEAAYHGVPIVGIPIYGDQGLNMRKAETSGFGVKLNYKNVTKESLLWAINTVLYDSSYQKEAKRRSAVFRDQPETPLERAIFWTEYVIRHKGAPHLRTGATNLAWYELYLLDVAFVLILSISLFVYVLLILCKYCCRSNKSNVSKQKKEK